MKRTHVPVRTPFLILVAALLIHIVPSSATHPTRLGSFTCRSSALRVLSTEPVASNTTSDPCADDADSALNNSAGAVSASVLTSATKQTPKSLSTTSPQNGDSAKASAGVAEVVIVAGGNTIRAGVLTSSASATCSDGQAVLAGSSEVVTLSVNNTAVGPLNSHMDLPGVGPITIHLNEKIQTADGVTQRALWIQTPLGDIVAGESSVGVKGSPCRPGVPQRSDGVDNDGDGKIDFPNDPGCASPGDDDESNPPFQCSDGIDNDGDGLADFPNDPDCDGPNDNNENPECSDGVDNDGDGKIDFPNDPECHSPDDFTEAPCPDVDVDPAEAPHHPDACEWSPPIGSGLDFVNFGRHIPDSDVSPNGAFHPEATADSRDNFNGKAGIIKEDMPLLLVGDFFDDDDMHFRLSPLSIAAYLAPDDNASSRWRRFCGTGTIEQFNNSGPGGSESHPSLAPFEPGQERKFLVEVFDAEMNDSLSGGNNDFWVIDIYKPGSNFNVAKCDPVQRGADHAGRDIDYHTEGQIIGGNIHIVTMRS